MARKTQQLQIRITAAQKADLKRLASRAGLDLSSYVMSRLVPAASTRFRQLVRGLRDEGERRFALAELNDLLAGLSPVALPEAIAEAELEGLAPLWQNYVAAMVEQASQRNGVAPPAWVRSVEPLDEPYFGAPFPSLRPHLLRAAPVAFKRRNIFVDSSVGDRV